MNWFKNIKLGKNFIRLPNNIDSVVDEIYNKILQTNLKKISKERYDSKLMDVYLFSPYLNMEIPTTIFVLNNRREICGDSYINLYQLINNYKRRGRRFLGIDQLDEYEGRILYEVLFSDDGEDADGDFENLQSVININMCADCRGGIKDTIYHEIGHILDPGTGIDSYSRDPDQYLFNMSEYNVRMNELMRNLINKLNEYPPEDYNNMLNYFVEEFKSGNFEVFIELISGSDSLTYSDFVDDYFENDKFRRMFISQMGKFLNELVQKSTNKTTVKS